METSRPGRRPFRQQWRSAADRLVAIQSYGLWTVAYWLGVAPYAILLRLVSDPLRIRREPASTWVPRPSRLTMNDARHQG